MGVSMAVLCRGRSADRFDHGLVGSIIGFFMLSQLCAASSLEVATPQHIWVRREAVGVVERLRSILLLLQGVEAPASTG